MRSIGAALLLSTIVLCPAFVNAKPDIAHGQALHSIHCTACHGAMTGGDGSALYTREPRLVNSMPELESRVRHCESGLKLHWSLADIDDVTRYLNQRYYRFGQYWRVTAAVCNTAAATHLTSSEKPHARRDHFQQDHPARDTGDPILPGRSRDSFSRR